MGSGFETQVKELGIFSPQMPFGVAFTLSSSDWMSEVG